LFDAVVVKFVIHPPAPEGVDQVTVNVCRKLAFMDENVCG